MDKKIRGRRHKQKSEYRLIDKHFLITETEATKIKELSKEMELSQSAYVRYKVFGY